MSNVMADLLRGRDLAWLSLRPVFDHAIAAAREAEYEAARSANIAQTAVDPAYPPFVTLLAEASR